MTYEEADYGPKQAHVTHTALVAPQAAAQPFGKPYVVLLLDFDGERTDTAWEGTPECARQLAAALLNSADRADEQAAQ